MKRKNFINGLSVVLYINAVGKKILEKKLLFPVSALLLLQGHFFSLESIAGDEETFYSCSRNRCRAVDANQIFFLFFIFWLDLWHSEPAKPNNLAEESGDLIRI